MTEMARIREFLASVEGWLTHREGELLYNLARGCPKGGVIVEVGSWKGRSTIWLGRGSKAGSRTPVYAIDPHTCSPQQPDGCHQGTTFREFERNLRKAGVNDIVTPIVKTSEEAAREFHRPVALLFVDGAHDYELVKLDFHVWFPKVMAGGIMAFHDTTRSESDGPKRVVEEFICKSSHFRNVRFVHSITYAEKVCRNSAKDRIRNLFVLMAKNLYELAGDLKLPARISAFGEALRALTLD